VRCLTNQDLVWLNTTITGVTQAYDYFAVESAIAGQYSYGINDNTLLAAATAYQRTMMALPFTHGNRRTGFTAMASFLAANGWQLTRDTASLVSALALLENHSTSATAVLGNVVEPVTSENSLSSSGMRQVVAWCMKRHEQVIKILADKD
jgi:prophage maintenance system killer protein